MSDDRDFAWSHDGERFWGGFTCRDHAIEVALETADPMPGDVWVVYTGWLDYDHGTFKSPENGEELYPVRDVNEREFSFEDVLRAQGQWEFWNEQETTR